jgi:hypothetical protein
MWLLVVALWQSAAAHASGAFASARVRESSGVAVSRAHPGVLWTHNDSGDGPYLYATDTNGTDRGALRVPRAYAQDWEDLALGPCPRDRGDCLYIADTGDNTERRPMVAVYVVPEPAPPSGPADTLRSTAEPRIVRIRYEDGPTDVEAIFIGRDTALYLVSKGRTRGIRLYRVPRGALRGADSLVTAAMIQRLAIEPVPLMGRVVTGADRGPDTQVAIRTYIEVYRFSQQQDGRLVPAGVCPLGQLEEQGEAVAYLDARTLVLTSEARRRARGDIHVLRCP